MKPHSWDEILEIAFWKFLKHYVLSLCLILGQYIRQYTCQTLSRNIGFMMFNILTEFLEVLLDTRLRLLHLYSIIWLQPESFNPNISKHFSVIKKMYYVLLFIKELLYQYWQFDIMRNCINYIIEFDIKKKMF